MTSSKEQIIRLYHERRARLQAIQADRKEYKMSLYNRDRKAWYKKQECKRLARIDAALAALREKNA